MTTLELITAIRSLTDAELVDRYEAAKEDLVLKTAFDREIARRGMA